MLESRKGRLVALIIVQIIVTVIHLQVEPKNSGTYFYHYSNWSYWLGMATGCLLYGYAFFLACPKCKAKQVFRGWSLSSLRWQEKYCYKCGYEIEKFL